MKKIPWIGEGSKYADYHVFGGGVMNQHRWENKITQWIQDDRNIDDKLSEPFVQFFTLVFENTSCPAKAWFGIHGNTISLVVGGIFLAAVIKSGNNKGIWLLLQDPPEINGWKSWDAKSTKFAAKPLKWFHTSELPILVTRTLFFGRYVPQDLPKMLMETLIQFKPFFL